MSQGFSYGEVLAMDMRSFTLLLKSLDRVQSGRQMDMLNILRNAHHAGEKDIKKTVQGLQERLTAYPMDEVEQVEVVRSDAERLKADMMGGFLTGRPGR